jgi:hypothetical protein
MNTLGCLNLYAWELISSSNALTLNTLDLKKINIVGIRPLISLPCGGLNKLSIIGLFEIRS